MWDGQCKAGQMCRECYHRRTANLAAVIASERKALEQRPEPGPPGVNPRAPLAGYVGVAR